MKLPYILAFNQDQDVNLILSMTFSILIVSLLKMTLFLWFHIDHIV